MWYDPALEVTMGSFLSSVLGLFNSTFRAVQAQPALNLFLIVPVFLVVFFLVANLIRQGGRGRL